MSLVHTDLKCEVPELKVVMPLIPGGFLSSVGVGRDKDFATDTLCPMKYFRSTVSHLREFQIAKRWSSS